MTNTPFQLVESYQTFISNIPDNIKSMPEPMRKSARHDYQQTKSATLALVKDDVREALVRDLDSMDNQMKIIYQNGWVLFENGSGLTQPVIADGRYPELEIQGLSWHFNTKNELVLLPLFSEAETLKVYPKFKMGKNFKYVYPFAFQPNLMVALGMRGHMSNCHLLLNALGELMPHLFIQEKTVRTKVGKKATNVHYKEISLASDPVVTVEPRNILDVPTWFVNTNPSVTVDFTPEQQDQNQR